jgi:hypothetical protein
MTPSTAPATDRIARGASVLRISSCSILGRKFSSAIKLRSWRLVGMTVAFLIYAAFVVYIIYQMVTAGPASLA